MCPKYLFNYFIIICVSDAIPTNDVHETYGIMRLANSKWIVRSFVSSVILVRPRRRDTRTRQKPNNYLIN